MQSDCEKQPSENIFSSSSWGEHSRSSEEINVLDSNTAEAKTVKEKKNENCSVAAASAAAMEQL